MRRSLVIVFFKKKYWLNRKNNLSDTVERPCRSIFVFIYLDIRSFQVQILVAVYDFALQGVNIALPISFFNLDRSSLIEWSDRSAFNLTQFLFRVVYIKLYRVNKHRKEDCLWCIFFSILFALTGFQHDNSWLFTKLLLLSSNAYNCKNPASLPHNADCWHYKIDITPPWRSSILFNDLFRRLFWYSRIIALDVRAFRNHGTSQQIKTPLWSYNELLCFSLNLYAKFDMGFKSDAYQT